MKINKLTLWHKPPYSGPMWSKGPACALFAVLTLAGSSRAAAAADQSVWMAALSSAYVVIDLTTGDLDGDGKTETAVCYREDVGRTSQVSGVMILRGKAPDQEPVFHVQLESVLCEKVRIANRKLGVLLQGNQQLTWTYGDEIKFRREKGGLYQTASVRGSTQTGPANAADKALDGDLMTSWAEGAAGTGIGQTLTIKFAKPTNIGAIGVLAGNGQGSRAFFDHNRIHRGSIEAKTEADFGDTGAGLDFASLGIESMGDRQEFTADNKPNVTYVRVDKRGVVELQLRIESVYLGDKRDETHIAELDIIPLLSLSETVDRAKALKPKEDAAPAPEEKKAPAVKLPDGNDTVKRLDEGGSAIPDDF
jgi:Nicotine adenine dinucleotide glycohydrolase (NADase)